MRQKQIENRYNYTYEYFNVNFTTYIEQEMKEKHSFCELMSAFFVFLIKSSNSLSGALLLSVVIIALITSFISFDKLIVCC